MGDKKPSISRILFTDYTAMLATLAILIIVGFFLYDRFIQQLAFTQELPFVVVIVCMTSLALIFWRVRLISSIFASGWKVQGDIVSVTFFRGRGPVIYVYTVQGEKYKTSNNVMRNRYTQSLKPGQKVTIMANRDNPKIAFIRDIYT